MSNELKVKVVASADPICQKCGHPRSNHPYRHPFVGPSRDDTVKGQAVSIEALQAEVQILNQGGIVEIASRNPSVMEYMKHWEGRAEAAEAELRHYKCEVVETALANEKDAEARLEKAVATLKEVKKDLEMRADMKGSQSVELGASAWHKLRITLTQLKG